MGKGLFVPKTSSSYKITNSLTLNGSTIQGDGTLLFNGADARFILNANSKVLGLHINGSANDSPGLCYIVGNNVVVKDNVFSNCSCAVYIERTEAYGSHGIIISDNQFLTCYTSILALRVSYSIFKSNYIQGVKGITTGIQFWGAIQCVITDNIIIGGITGISCIVNPLYSGLCPFQCNTISNNTVTHVSEETISLDGRYNTYPNGVFEIDTVSSKSLVSSGGNVRIKMSNANWSSTGSIGQYSSYYITFTSGKLVGMTFPIISQTEKDSIDVQVPNVSGRSLYNDIGADEFVIGLPMYNNVISNNTLEISYKTTDYLPTGIVLWGYACGNTISNNTIRRTDTQGSTNLDCNGIVLANLAGITYGAGANQSVTQTALKAPCMNNIICGNNGEGVQVQLVNGMYGASYPSYGNIFTNNKFTTVYGNDFENYFTPDQFRNIQVTNSFVKSSVSVNVRDFGAVGDGITDDTVAIQSALDYMESNNSGDLVGGIVKLGRGIFVVSSPIVIPRHVKVFGEGSYSTEISASGNFNGEYVIQLGDLLQNNTPAFASMLRHCKVNCNGVSGGVYSIKCQEESGIYDCIIFNPQSYGIYFRGDLANAYSSYGQVRGTHIWMHPYGTDGIKLNAAKSFIHETTVLCMGTPNTTLNGIFVTGYTFPTINSCHFENFTNGILVEQGAGACIINVDGGNAPDTATLINLDWYTGACTVNNAHMEQDTGNILYDKMVNLTYDTATYGRTMNFYSKNGWSQLDNINNVFSGKVAAVRDFEILDSTKGVILKASNGNRYRLTVDVSGSLFTTLV